MTNTKYAATEPFVDFDEAVSAYERGLIERLRGFESAPYLDVWVPDDDPLQSFVNMLDAALSLSLDSIRIALSQSAIERMGGLDAIVDAASPFGAFKMQRQTQSVVVHVSHLQVPLSKVVMSRRPTNTVEGLAKMPSSARMTEFPAVFGPCYHVPSNAQVGEDEDQQRTWTDCRVGRAMLGDVELAVGIDPEGTVVDMSYRAEGHVLAMSVLDVLCRIGMGRPAIELRDHGVDQLERQCRLDLDHWPCAGIVNPSVVDPVFAAVLQLVRDAIDGVVFLATPSPDRNTFEERPTRVWSKLDADGKRRAVAEVLRDASSRFEVRLPLHEIQGDRRVVVRVDRRPGGRLPDVLRKAERMLRSRLDPGIELLVTELQDRNQNRRLSLIK